MFLTIEFSPRKQLVFMFGGYCWFSLFFCRHNAGPVFHLRDAMGFTGVNARIKWRWIKYAWGTLLRRWHNG